ncbi:DUF4232 domain-containing protein [Streptomyces carpinensis]|uniref:DUF4232 domain-containing protein n=1 Tax=Streptomyces carpinensis TaxID=66369 RepID=A0ABV1VYA0_9ACTN|nr:DUF4232 domain-containing protein [Streptomyces carpinensis]
MRRSAALVLPVLSTVLLLSGCGSEHAGTPNARSGAATSPHRTRVDAPGTDGVRITAVTIPSPSPSPTRSHSVHADRLPTDSGVFAEYEVTNDGTQALTYTVLFDFTTGAGEVMSNKWETVRDVGPGRTVRGTVRLGVPAPGASPVTQVEVAQVTKVPADEAPPAAGTCPPSGVRVTADRGDAAMGLRVVGLHLENCGTRDYTVSGYPQLELLDQDREPVEGVRILRGSGAITTLTEWDKPPRPVVLKPGETAVSGLVWRNTTESGTPVDVPYVRVRAKAGADPVTVTPHLDLGTTGKLGVRPWQREQR